ncbi:sensor histidine kinase [Amorphus orientalis]|uniref:histidine kinase n=1 Tax=Amorphus orientalis TaxID=649198 RepID=A0AAE3VU23_9HYPH|nr:ATP-binding protein [Amorphus orientalis]MDQ0317616.1 C4-dicarboxylate-specific signal transduction histidine kinase [Amorphus orientalis]
MTGWFGRSKRSTSSSSDQSRSVSRGLTIVLAITTLGLFASTALLYWEREQGREALSASIRTSGWVAYQAQLELVKSLSAVRVASFAPTDQNFEDLQLRLAILSSRLPLLYDSEDGKLLTDIEQYKGQLQGYETTLDTYLDAAPTTLSEWERVAWLDRVQSELEGLQPVLQTLLQSSIANNREITRREEILAESPAFLPLALLFVSGGLLVLFLYLQTTRDRERLNAMQEAQEEAAASRQSLHALVESMPAIIVVFDPQDYSVSFANVAATKMIDRPYDDPEWRRFIATSRSGLGSSGDQGSAFSFQKEDGSIIALRGLCVTVVWEGRPQCLIALGDNTQIRDAEYQLLQAAKLSTLGEMASAITHEINQPLAVIRMAAANARHLLARDDTAAVLAKISRIDEQVERAKRITDQVRRYGRKAKMSTERFPIARTIDLAIGFVAEQFRLASINLALDIALPDGMTIEGEQTLFEQVIVNILLNARDAFEGCETDEPRNRTVTIRATTTGVKVYLIIEDNAGGIPDAMIGTIFEPFMTTKPEEKGTGLGLSMSRNIVRKMDGDIHAENTPDGARFTVVVPVPQTAASARSAA